jgi:hypothetical protein
MKYMKLSKILLGGLLILATSCGGGENIIPPAIEPDPDPTPPVEDVFNNLGFTPHVDGQPFDTYRGLVMAGYQGWFGAPGDGCSHAGHANTEWYHYRENEGFKPGVLRNSIDFWPDMSEYEIQYTPGDDGTSGRSEHFLYPNGEKATVYSAYDKSSVLLHFKWMKDYGIDGVFMQRFVGEVIDNPDGKDHFDKVLESAMEGSNTHQRAICVMYDLGGFKSGNSRGIPAVLADAQAIMDKYQLKDRSKQKFYLHQNGKPLITLWGVGFNDGRPYSLADIEELMNGLKEKGFSIMLGVPTYWRDRRNDALPDARLHDLIKAADVIMPWFVGRYDDNSFPNFHSLIEQDIKWCNDNGVDYAPLCFPGSADRNMHPNNGVNARLGGKFLWNQMYHSIRSGAQMLYIAMFDEIDEGTAIYKCLNQKDVPGNKTTTDYYVVYRNGNYSISSTNVEGLTGNDWCRLANNLNVTFLGIEDNLPTDHYLWLTAQGRKMLRGEIPLKSTWPAR